LRRSRWVLPSCLLASFAFLLFFSCLILSSACFVYSSFFLPSQLRGHLMSYFVAFCVRLLYILCSFLWPFLRWFSASCYQFSTMQ
jgi:hypothetical protein